MKLDEGWLVTRGGLIIVFFIDISIYRAVAHRRCVLCLLCAGFCQGCKRKKRVNIPRGWGRLELCSTVTDNLNPATNFSASPLGTPSHYCFLLPHHTRHV